MLFLEIVLAQAPLVPVAQLVGVGKVAGQTVAQSLQVVDVEGKGCGIGIEQRQQGLQPGARGLDVGLLLLRDTQQLGGGDAAGL